MRLNYNLSFKFMLCLFVLPVYAQATNNPERPHPEDCFQPPNTLYTQSPDGTQIAFDVAGQGPTVIMLHGGSESRQSWHDAGYVDRTKGAFQVITMDLRGHGESDKPVDQTSYTTDKLVQDILAVADYCGAKTFVLWGYSYGGNISRYLAAQSERVAGSIIIGIPFGPGASDEFRTYIDDLENHWRPILEAQEANTLDRDKLSNEDQVVLKEHNPSLTLAWLNAILDWTTVLPGDLRSPTLWLIGSENMGAMASLSEFQESLPDSVQVRVIEGLTHEQEFTDIDKVLPALLEFTHAVWVEQATD
jgi:pimeloyl-ACP methyl ester carboxylesterase